MYDSRTKGMVNNMLLRTLAIVAIAVAFLCPPPFDFASYARAAQSDNVGNIAGDGERATVEMVRAKIKHVFVIYQENHSFDEYFGTYPGADNLASAEAQNHGFRQYDPIGKTWITPFRITDPDIESPSQARKALEAKMDGGKMDAFVSEQEKISLHKFAHNPQAARDVGIGTMAYYDCDTLPFLWKYAKTFALFDHIFETMTGPSTPGNISVIAAQSGQTQGARNPNQRIDPDDKGPGDPVVNDLDPAFGPSTELYRAKQLPQSYATLMLTLGGTNDTQVTQDTDGVARDLGAMIANGHAPVPWGWYQEGYVTPTLALPGYVMHHNAPQYFGYIRNNDVMWNNVHDARSMLAALSGGTLPGDGVFYIKGSAKNEFGWKPANPDPFVQANYVGDDDHPGPDDADHQIGESFVATFVNAIARSTYWKDSAIIVAWDDPGGFYDHVPPPQFEQCPDGHPCGDGPRIPFLMISPYARSGAVVHDSGETASIVKFVDDVFGLPALSSLPDEKPYMPEGPRDGNPAITDLLGAFDPARLAGTTPPIPATDAEIDDSIVNAFPPKMSCSSLGITPVTLPNAPSTPPPGFAPRPRATHGS
jgi:phospholipase C